jgi:hypothetical protein
MKRFETRANSRPARVYRMNAWIRLFAAGFLLFSVLGLLGVLWTQRAGIRGRGLAELIEWAAIALFAAGWALYVFTAAIVLSSTTIEKRTLLRAERLRFDEILGRREKIHRNFDGSYIRYLQVIPRDGLLPKIQFQKFYVLDAGFYAWYDDLPDLDSSDQLRSGRISVRNDRMP